MGRVIFPVIQHFFSLPLKCGRRCFYFLATDFLGSPKYVQNLNVSGTAEHLIIDVKIPLGSQSLSFPKKELSLFELTDDTEVS